MTAIGIGTRVRIPGHGVAGLVATFTGEAPNRLVSVELADGTIMPVREADVVATAAPVAAEPPPPAPGQAIDLVVFARDLARRTRNLTTDEANALILGRTLLGEAACESRAGKEGVANVVMNRVRMDLNSDGKSDWWGEGVIEVCLKPWQFSCWNFADPNRRRILLADRGHQSFDECLAVARAAINGPLADNTSGAVQYLNIPLTKRVYGALPNWVSRMRETVVIGRHTFFAL